MGEDRHHRRAELLASVGADWKRQADLAKERHEELTPRQMRAFLPAMLWALVGFICYETTSGYFWVPMAVVGAVLSVASGVVARMVVLPVAGIFCLGALLETCYDSGSILLKLVGIGVLVLLLVGGIVTMAALQSRNSSDIAIGKLGPLEVERIDHWKDLESDREQGRPFVLFLRGFDTESPEPIYDNYVDEFGPRHVKDVCWCLNAQETISEHVGRSIPIYCLLDARRPQNRSLFRKVLALPERWRQEVLDDATDASLLIVHYV